MYYFYFSTAVATQQHYFERLVYVYLCTCSICTYLYACTVVGVVAVVGQLNNLVVSKELKYFFFNLKLNSKALFLCNLLTLLKNTFWASVSFSFKIILIVYHHLILSLPSVSVVSEPLFFHINTQTVQLFLLYLDMHILRND